MSFEQAASAPVAALTALQGLRDKGRIRRGHKVLINGASGGVGTFAVQIAKLFGAHVTGVCSMRNIDMVRSIGANRVIDYTRDDVSRGGERYDIILDCVGNAPLSACRRVLNPKGRLVLVGAPDRISAIIGRILGALLRSGLGSKKMSFFVAKANEEDLTALGELMASGMVTPVIDRRYGFIEAGEAFRYSAKGHASGKVLITL